MILSYISRPVIALLQNLPAMTLSIFSQQMGGVNRWMGLNVQVAHFFFHTYSN